MISLAAWMTVSMSALSKLSTTKRPRCSAGTSGAVLGAGGSVGGASTRGGCSAVSGLGPTEADGTGGSDARDGGGGRGTVTAADGGAGRRAGRPGVAHPARSVMRQTAAVARFTLLLRLWRLLDGFARRRQGETAPQAWRQTPAGRKESVDRRSLRLRHRLLRHHDPWRDQTGLWDGLGRGRRRCGNAGRRRLPRSAGLPRLCRWRGSRLGRIAEPHVDVAVGPGDHHVIGGDLFQLAPGDRVADAVAPDALCQRILEVRDRVGVAQDHALQVRL